MKSVRGALVVVLLLLVASRADAADELRPTAQCNGKWVTVAHGVDLSKSQAFFSRDNAYWYGPIVLDSFVPDIGGGYAHIDYDVDIFVQSRVGGVVAASGKVHTPTCGGLDIRPTATVPPTTTSAPSSKLVIAPTTTVTPQLSWLSALPDSLLRAIVEAVRGLP